MKKTWRFCVIIGILLFIISGCAGETGSRQEESETATAADAEDTVDTENGADAEGATDVKDESAVKDCAFKATFLDTGKSDCIIMEMGDAIVVNDTADADDAADICAFLDERGVERIEYLILSHFDKDHIGSAAALLSKYDVGCVLMPDHEEDSEPYLMLTQALAQTGAEERRLVEDYSFTLAGIVFTVDAPEEVFYDDDNNYSLITTVTCGETRLLLMGDALKKRTGEFLDSDAGEERYDLIKMPHHGDYNKKLSELFALARPEYVILTAGEERTRVEDKTIELLEKSGCQAFYTDEGTVTALSDGRTVTVMQ